MPKLGGWDVKGLEEDGKERKGKKARVSQLSVELATISGSDLSLISGPPSSVDKEEGSRSRDKGRG